jgi:hypothetical protein
VKAVCLASSTPSQLPVSHREGPADTEIQLLDPIVEPPQRRLDFSIRGDVACCRSLAAQKMEIPVNNEAFVPATGANKK